MPVVGDKFSVPMKMTTKCYWTMLKFFSRLMNFDLIWRLDCWVYISSSWRRVKADQGSGISWSKHIEDKRRQMVSQVEILLLKTKVVDVGGSCFVGRDGERRCKQKKDKKTVVQRGGERRWSSWYRGLGDGHGRLMKVSWCSQIWFVEHY